MRKHYSLIHADKVLNILYKTLGRKEDQNLTLEVWSNGREQGYCICDFNSFEKPTKVVFAQQRNSDAIIVIHGPMNQFNVSDNLPDDDLWETNNRCFDNDTKAAKHILSVLPSLKVTA